MDTTILQVPLSKTLKSNATNIAKEIGFSSLQDFVRLVLTKLSHRELNVNIEQAEFIKLSPAAKKRYARMTEDFKKGRNIYHAKDVDDLLRQLNS